MRTAGNSLWRESDGRFSVVAERRTGRKKFRVRAWIKGNSPATEAADSELKAIEAAENIWNAYQEGLIDNQLAQPQHIGELAKLVEQRTDIRKATIESYKSVLDLLVTALGEEHPLEEIRKHHILQWLSKAECSDTSKATYVRTVTAVFNWAVKKKWMLNNPCKGIRIPSRHVMRPWLETAEWPAFLEACEDKFRIRAEFVLETGLRRSELKNARWSWITSCQGRPCIRIQEDAETGFIPKSGRTRIVPLSARAQADLEQAREVWGNEGYIFFDTKSPWPNLTRSTHRACVKAGVTDVDFHGLRRSAGARWLSEGIAIQDVSRLLGHQDVGTTMRHYAGISDSHLSACIARIDDIALSRRGEQVPDVTLDSVERIPA
jgi:integrase